MSVDSRPVRWTRRAFVQSLGCASALGAANSFTPKSLARASESRQSDVTGTVYVGSDVNGGEIHVFSANGLDWKCKQRVSSRTPTFMALHPGNQFLYVVNGVDESDGLPCGSVEAYAVNSESDQISLINRRNLSLSASDPSHLAISPDGSHVIVAAHGGGAYNVLPIELNGVLGPVSARLKEIGSGPNSEHQKSAHPHAVLFDAEGRHFFATDAGCDRLTVFQLEPQDASAGTIQIFRKQQVRFPAGAGPTHAVLHPNGSFLYVANSLTTPSITTYRLAESSGLIDAKLGSVEFAKRFRGDRWSKVSMAIRTDGDVLYSSVETDTGHGEVTAWKIDKMSGSLSHMQRLSVSGHLGSFTFTAGGAYLFALDNRSEAIVHIPTDDDCGRFGKPSVIAQVPSPISMTVRLSNKSL
jgi:6-phosphogluconolactonase